MAALARVLRKACITLPPQTLLQNCSRRSAQSQIRCLYATGTSTYPNEQNVEPPPPPSPDSPAEASNTTGAISDCPEAKKLEEAEKAFHEERNQLAEKIKDTEDKFKRALADSDNLRKRMLKQVEDAKLFAIHGFCKDLLDVADVLEKATESVPQEELNDKNQHLKNLFEGLKMTDLQLQKVFSKNGLEKIDPIDQKFDPNEHEALFESVFEGKDAGTVGVVTKIGYKLHNRIVRPAVVGVAKTPS